MKSIGGTILLAGSFLIGMAPPADAAAVVTYHSTFGARAEDIDSVQMLFDFGGGSSWRRMFDSVSQFSDNGLARDANDAPDVLPPVDNSASGFMPWSLPSLAMAAGAAAQVKVSNANVQQTPSSSNDPTTLTGSAPLTGSVDPPTPDDTGSGGAPGVVVPDLSVGSVGSVQAFDPMSPASGLGSASTPAAAVANPEPGTRVLMIIGFVGVVMGSLRRRRAS